MDVSAPVAAKAVRAASKIRSRLRAASALLEGPDQVGLAGALAVTGSIVASTGAGFINSSHAAWAVLGCCGLVALALGVISTSSWAKAAAARNGQRLATAPTPESQGHPTPRVGRR
jgi:hypothetical protein